MESVGVFESGGQVPEMLLPYSHTADSVLYFESSLSFLEEGVCGEVSFE